MEFEKEYRAQVFSRLIKHFLLGFFGLIGVWIGSNLTVSGAVWFAYFLGVQNDFIALTIIAVGTSLPELAVSLAAVKKSTPEILLGNIIGSNISNILLIGGLSAVLYPVVAPVAIVSVPILLMLLVSALLWISVFGEWKITRLGAFFYFVVYLVFLYWLVSGHNALP